MTDILCRWLNHDLQLSKAVDPSSFAKDFSTGYLIGEVLQKYQLQNDFSIFTKKDTSVSKLNNFTRLQPTLRLLGISFDINTAQDLMQEKQGVATRLLYQLYISLEKKKKADIGGTMMEIMQPAASASLHKKELESFSDRLHQVVKREAELKLQKISQRYEEKYLQLNEKPVPTNPIQQEKIPKVQDSKRFKSNEKLQVNRQKLGLMYQPAAIIQLPKPPPYTSKLNLKKRQLRKEQQAKIIQTEIAQFETKKKKLVTSVFSSSSSGLAFPNQGNDNPESEKKLILRSNSKYIQEIRQRLKENAAACEQREKRLDRFLVEQLKAHEAQEEARRDEQLVKRLTRQTLQEQRLAAQLLQIRMQKDVIRQNRLFREQQYQQQREKDFKEALDREAAMVQQAKLERAEELRKQSEFCSRVAAERAQSRYEKHFKICRDSLKQIVDLATKVGEYRLLTAENLIPEKLMREWKELVLRGLPLYEPVKGHQPDNEFSATLDPIELKKLEILNNQDYDEYTNMIGEWEWQEKEGEMRLPLTNNNILGHVVQRMRNIAHPPIKPSTPLFPQFTIKACVLGKFCSGKTTCLAKIAEAHSIHVLSTETLIEEAINAYKNEEVTEQQGEKDDELTSSTSLTSDLKVESKHCNSKLSTRATLEAGAIIPDEVLVDIIVEAIRRVPAGSGWILDGFPLDITQALLLVKALGGCVDEENVGVSSRTNLAPDPDPPSPPPPPAPVLDLALLLDVSDECVVRRAFSHHDTDADAASHHKTLYQAQSEPRISAFQDTWPKLDEWFREKQKILVHVDADVDCGELYSRVESILHQVMLERQADQPLDLGDDALGPAVTSSILKEEKVQRVTSSSRRSSTSAYVDNPLPPEISECLCSYWDTVCDSYVNNVKAVMQQLRSHRAYFNHHLFNISEVYRHYLGRPDLKQELVSQWQKHFNSIPDNMRDNEEAKAELHTRLDELCERLWDIVDKRKAEDEEERAALISDGWLEENIAVLTNHHSELMQVELNRFQETHSILRVYYVNMYKHRLSKPTSRFEYFPLLETSGIMDQDGSTPLFIHPETTEGTSKTNGQYLTEAVKPPHEKLITDCELALAAISKMVSEESHQRETKELKEKQEEPEINEQPPAIASKSNGKQSLKKQQALSTPPLPPSPSPPEEKHQEQTHNPPVTNKIYKEFAVAMKHEENAAKVRFALVKGHGLMVLQSLQGRAQQTFSNMEQWSQARYGAEMKSIDQLAEVVRHHIEAGAMLQNELVLECSDFYLNGDFNMVPPLCPAPLEKPLCSTPSITRPESLYPLLYNHAPSGLMLTSEFSSWLEVLVKNEAQVMEIASLLTDDHKLIDWRRFLLSAALPWPFPSLTQLLDVLQRFKAADGGNAGCVNEEQYLQTELWFSTETVLAVSEDPTEPVPHNRLADLRKFFFQLFADHSISPPRVDYVSMLLYFAADPNPRQGFIRALSIVLGQHLEHSSSLDNFVKSMPRIVEALELTSTELDGAYEEEETPSDSSSGGQGVTIPALLAVICHETSKMKDNCLLPPGCPSQEENTEDLAQVFRELGYNPEDCVPFSILSQHPLIQHFMETSTHFQLVDIHRVLLPLQDGGDSLTLF
ncbi:sperm flagellar protein 2 [Parambassis ranga]|uniref:Sperm flagellar protein 2 n=1 Tax=Parambassis ranga TaxID=210632 RepID=A0A6P7IZK7_9TELE|nr:sperm flagellar protein 2 [Parambassis ranga]